MEFIFTIRNLTFLVMLLLSTTIFGQCAVGEEALYLTIQTDNWGYETYWQITPEGNACGEQMIAEGGNLVQVGCNGGGDQDATTVQGYENQSAIEEGPICLTIGASYTLHYVDDYGDGGANFDFSIFGLPLYQYEGLGNGGSFNFTVTEPAPYDVEGHAILTYSYLELGQNQIKGHFFNSGSETIENVEFSYSIDAGTNVTATIFDLAVPPFTSFELIHPTEWMSSAFGEYEVDIWCSSINGNADNNTGNDLAEKVVTIGPGIPNILDDYLGFVPQTEVIASSAQSVQNPRDLDFHPILSRNELWIILKSTESSGGKTIKISNAGQDNQTSLLQQDGNAWHFMSLPTGIAFSQNENFATSPGVYDANHDGGSPFTGPSLWNSDPNVYAQESGGNGSHLDMLHESPYSMGIAYEIDNKFWVTCGDHNEVMSYDFQDDHGPGNSDHSDGIIYKYPIPGYNEDSNHEVPDHLVFDHNTGWLYVCNSQQNRVIRINTLSGTPGADVTPNEPTEIYKYMEDFEWEEIITTGLDAPTGIDIVENRLIVSNYNNGDINLYDISSDTPVLIGVIPTLSPGIMGVKVGPDGLIWFVNSITDKVMRISMQPVSVFELETDTEMFIYPNPAQESLFIHSNSISNFENIELKIVDMNGRIVHSEVFVGGNSNRFDISKLNNGIFEIMLMSDAIKLDSKRLVIAK